MTEGPDKAPAPDPQPERATSQPTTTGLGVLVDGRYRIVEPLAAGGMGSVYLGMQDNLNRRVAIKRVSQPEERDAERFRREAEALAVVSHPAIVEVHDYVEEPSDGASYLVMAYVAGENLDDYVASSPDGVLAPLEALDLMVPVASALVELHAHDILHRDIKPANLVRYTRADGRAAVKLVDFGIARRAQDPGLTAEGLIVGTPPYLAPEVILGKGHSEASDVYAFGATLFELLTGAPPHGKEDLHQILKHATQEDVVLPAELNTTPLGTLLLRVLNRDEEGRPTMRAVQDQLEQIRLTELLESSDPSAALQATRNISGGTLPPGAGPAPQAVNRRAATAMLSPREGTAPPPGVSQNTAPPGATALVSAPDPNITHPVQRIRATSTRGGGSRTVVPWIVAGAATVVALVVTIVLLAQGSDDKPKKGRDGAPAPNAASSDVPSAVSGGGMRRPASMPISLDSTAQAKTAAELLASCTSVNKAYLLFARANNRRHKPEHRGWCKAAFTAVIGCKYASDGQKRWSAYRLSQLHAKSGDCDDRDRAWKMWLLHGGSRKSGHLKKPSCKER